MAQTSTQDNQKVFQSATHGFKSFVGAVDNPSSSKNMELVYGNMAKLFDAFTKGVLTEQGSNSEVLLRTVYRSLGEDFLNIVKDSKAADKIAELMKSKRESLNPQTVDDAMVSETTKKVVKQTLDPNNLDPTSVVLDFMDELQTAILQVKLNLTREHERRQLARKKSLEGVSEDIDTLTGRLQEQASELAASTRAMDETDSAFVDWQLDETERLFDLFRGVGRTGNLNRRLSGVLGSFARDPAFERFLGGSDRSRLLGLISKIQHATLPGWAQERGKMVPVQGGIPPQENPPSRGEIAGSTTTETTLSGTTLTTTNAYAIDLKEIDKLYAGSTKLVSSANKQMSDFASSSSAASKKVGMQPQGTSTNRKTGTTSDLLLRGPLASSSSQGRMATPSPASTGITEQGVVDNIGRIGTNIADMLKDKKFQRNFLPRYAPIQKLVQKGVGEAATEEEKVQQDLEETKVGINRLRRSQGRGNLLTRLMSTVAWASTVAVGGVILVGLGRALWRNWKRKYMPDGKGDGKTFRILGIPIPGFNELKAFGMGIYNFVAVGLPLHFQKVKGSVSRMYNALFGKKGCIRNADMLMLTMKKLGAALLIGLTKKAGGTLVKFLLKAASFIPYVGPVFAFLAKFGPDLYSFIATQLMLAWGRNRESQISQSESYAQMQLAKQQAEVRAIRKKLRKFSAKLRPFAPPEAVPGLMTPKWSPGDVNRGRPQRAAIWRAAPKVGFAKTHASSEVERSRTRSVNVNAASSYQQSFLQQGGGDVRGNLMGISGNGDFASALEAVVVGNYNAWVESRKVGDERKAAGIHRGMVMSSVKRNLKPVVEARIKQLTEYLKNLKKLHENRFEKVKGPLYDIDRGWNPAYRLNVFDLLSAMPMNPFLPLHGKMDLTKGVPYGQEETLSKGYMPFKWWFYTADGKKFGTPIVADPIKHEMARAEQRIRWLNDMLQHLGTRTVYASDQMGWVNRFGRRLNAFWIEGSDPNKNANVLLKNITQAWFNEWVGKFEAPNGGDWGNTSYPFNFKNKFQEQVARWALGTSKKSPEEATVDDIMAIKDVSSTVKLSSEKTFVVKIDNKDLSADRKGALDYLKESKLRGKKAGLWLTKLRDNWAMFAKRDERYASVRTLMMDWGIAHLFDKPIMSPPSQAAHIVEGMTKHGMWDVWPLGKKAGTIGYMLPLLGEVLTKRYGAAQGVFDRACEDPTVVQTFARSFLEYFGYIVLPQWKLVDRMIMDYTGNGGDETKIQEQIGKLADLFLQKTIVDWVMDHIRFRNMKVNVIDYANAEGEEQRKMLDGYRRKRGILTPLERAQFVNTCEQTVKNLGKMSPSQLKGTLVSLEGAVKKAAYEAKYTGDHGFEEDLRKYYTLVWNAYKAASGTDGTKLPNIGNSAYIVDNYVDRKLTPKQEREERERMDAARTKKLEEQRRKKAEEARKRLAAEAKRKEELVIAQQKIARMEELRRQEAAYEEILEKMVADPKSVSEADMRRLGEDVKTLKQEAENRISKLPREQRDLKLAIIRGDNLSDKTFGEVKETASGLHGSLQDYIDEVNKIPVGNVLAIQRTQGTGGQEPIKLQDSDSVDLGDE